MTTSNRGSTGPDHRADEGSDQYTADDGRSMVQRMLDGDHYRADAEIAELHATSVDLVTAYNATGPREKARRRELLEQLLGGIGEDTEIRPPLHVDYGWRTTIGARTFANFGLVLLDVAPVVIGDDVQIGPNVQFLTPTHPLEAGPRRDKWESAQPITVGDNVWLGGGVIVCPGVTIGSNTVVGSGAVVTRDLPAGVLAVGAPARVVRELH
jgi:maltose O-acetyltransferase